MCWQCENPEATTEAYLASLRTKVTQHRWAIQYVEGDRPFGYTIGLHPKGLPELLITGLPPNTSARLINSIAHQTVDDGMTLRPGTHIDYQGEFFLEVVEVDQPDVHLVFAAGLFGAGVRAVQLVWTDDYRRWPWDRGWSNRGRRQPVLGVRSPAPR